MYVNSYCDMQKRTVQNQTALKNNKHCVFQLGFRQDVKGGKYKENCSEEFKVIGSNRQM